MKTYAQGHRWNNVSCQEHSVLFLHLFATLSATQISWRATVVLLTIFVKGIPLCDTLFDGIRLSCTELSIAVSVLQVLACFRPKYSGHQHVILSYKMRVYCM